MSWRVLNNIVLIIIMAIGGCYIVNLNQSASQAILFSTGVGPTYFPNILTGILFFLCIVVFIQDKRKAPEKEKLTFPNIKYILFTLFITIAFIASWQFLGHFYLNVFALIAILISLYRKEKGVKNSILVGVITSVFTTLFVYFLFEKILTISF